MVECLPKRKRRSEGQRARSSVTSLSDLLHYLVSEFTSVLWCFFCRATNVDCDQRDKVTGSLIMFVAAHTVSN